MKKTTLCGALLACVLLRGAGPACAAGSFTYVDSFSDPSYRFEQGEFVYRKNQDVLHYRISTGEKTPVTGNGPLLEETPVWVEDSQVWYLSHRPGAPAPYSLFRFHLADERNDLLYACADEISGQHAARDGGVLVLSIGGDWWAWNGSEMEQLTFSGTDLPKWTPALQRYHLVWIGGGGVHHTHVLTRETRAVSEREVTNSSLRAASTHAAWVEPAPPGESGYRVRLMSLGTLEVVTVDTSQHAALYPIRFHPPYMIYVKSTADQWSIMRLLPYSPHPETLYTSGLPLDNPALNGTDLFFLVTNCADNMCMELYKHNLTTGDTVRLTSHGQGFFVGHYGVDGDRIAFLRFNGYDPQQPLELFAGQVEPGPVCGTTLPTAPAPLNLVLLVAPLLAVWALRLWYRTR